MFRSSTKLLGLRWLLFAAFSFGTSSIFGFTIFVVGIIILYTYIQEVKTGKIGTIIALAEQVGGLTRYLWL